MDPMSLIIDSNGWTKEQLRGQAERLRDGLVQLTDFFAQRTDPMANPWALEYGLNLCRRSTDLATEILAAEESSPERLACVVNQLYEVGNSLPIFLKFSEVPPPPVPSRTPKAE
jgi:hypothetical protein